MSVISVLCDISVGSDESMGKTLEFARQQRGVNKGVA